MKSNYQLYFHKWAFTISQPFNIEGRMAAPSSLQSPVARGSRVMPPISSGDSARYTRDLLETLKGIAIRQGHMVLASLLEAAACEADRIAQG